MTTRTPTAYELFVAPQRRRADEQAEAEKLFFSNVVLPNGTFKTTHHRRLDDLNAIVSCHLPDHRPLNIMDVAVSSGVSTAEWLERLHHNGVDFQMVAGDLSANGYLLSRGNNTHILVDRRGEPLQYDIAGSGIRAHLLRPDDKHAIAAHPIRMLALRLLAAAFSRVLRKSGDTHSSPKIEKFAGATVRQIPLLSKSLQNQPRLRIVDDDILSDHYSVPHFHVVRAANILSPVYFAPPVLVTMIRNLKSRILPGGLLIVCRTLDDGGNDATVFRLNQQRVFEVLVRLNNGSEIEALILS